MRKDLIKLLDAKVKEVAETFSNPDRPKNTTAETFTPIRVIPLSELTAIAFFRKNSGKLALAFFYYINSGKYPRWGYYFPTDSHILGMNQVDYYKKEIEKLKAKYNFTGLDQKI